MQVISKQEFNELKKEVDTNLKEYTTSSRTAELMGRLLGLVRLQVEEE